MSRLALAAIAIASAIVTFAVAPPAEARFVSFKTPSKNIGCMYETRAAELRCDILEFDGAAPAQPASCEFDYGHAFFISKIGNRGRLLCVSDSVFDPGAPTLGYGKTKKLGTSITCKSTKKSLRCTNRKGHGFDLSRQKRIVF